jgi:hypothetical protein
MRNNVLVPVQGHFLGINKSFAGLKMSVGIRAQLLSAINKMRAGVITSANFYRRGGAVMWERFGIGWFVTLWGGQSGVIENVEVCTHSKVACSSRIQAPHVSLIDACSLNRVDD